jgi:hypothetical protein
MIALTFAALDCGTLDETLNLPNDSSFISNVKIAPELIHLSRFAESYQLRCDSNFPTKNSLCRRNAAVAKKLHFDATARMWSVLASLYELIGSDDKSSAKCHPHAQSNHVSAMFLSTVKNLLLERADAGDIQTCVTICEVIGILSNRSNEAEQKTIIPGISVTMVREWYL